jgi:hypothetical protein
VLSYTEGWRRQFAIYACRGDQGGDSLDDDSTTAKPLDVAAYVILTLGFIAY